MSREREDEVRECTPGSMVLLTRLAKQFYRRSDEELLGMHLRHLIALATCATTTARPQQDLADAFCMDANNVVLLLNELEELGYVTRLRDPHDRRRHVVQLTTQGAARCVRAEQAQEASRTTCCRRSTPMNAQTLLAAADARAARLRAAPAWPSRRGQLSGAQSAQRDDRVDLDLRALAAARRRRPSRAPAGPARRRTP